MKKAEAISILAASVRPREAKDRARYDEAVRMAIEALKCSERTAETAQNVKDGDLISRKAVIDLITDADEITNFTTKGVLKSRVRKLPSAQPEIIRCKDCKYMIDIGDDLMCDNAKGWVVATTSDFGCVLAERRTE